jgi:HD-GYP domain-containing protein (c-di-GMP phosphodiesterase class II)
MLDSASRGIVEILGQALAMKDPYTVGHQINVAGLARAMAKKGGYDEAFQERVYYAGLVHDLGKITIPSAILSKPGRLTDIELSLIRNHALYGWDILSSVDLPWPLADIVVQHHERLDGSGYPKGLRGDAIGREARFLSVADVVEAMTSHRPYRPGLGIVAALDEIRSHRGGWFDPEAVDLCIAVIEEGFTFDGGSYRLFLP